MSTLNSCAFCAIADGTIPAAVVYTDDHVVAFLDRAPITVGHTLIVPRGHCADITTMPDDVLARVMTVTKALAVRYRHALGADGFNVRHNAGAAAHQDVFHAHVHVLPRWNGDGLELGARAAEELPLTPGDVFALLGAAGPPDVP